MTSDAVVVRKFYCDKDVKLFRVNPSVHAVIYDDYWYYDSIVVDHFMNRKYKQTRRSSRVCEFKREESSLRLVIKGEEFQDSTGENEENGQLMKKTTSFADKTWDDLCKYFL